MQKPQFTNYLWGSLKMENFMSLQFASPYKQGLLMANKDF